jgi:CheY-like chemotaxis protein
MSNLAILVVEDDDAVCRMLGLALRGFGFSVQLASSGVQAIDIFQREPFDVVLMDVRMPDMDGPQTMAALKKIDPIVVCCFMSADPGRYDSEDLIRRGASGVIQKPFALEELRQFLLKSSADGARRSEEEPQQASPRERRAFPRLPATPDVKISCFIGRLDYGSDQAKELLDLSESGLRLLLKGPIDVGQEVFVTLEGDPPMRPMMCAGKVVWTDKAPEAGYSTGVLLDRCLRYKEVSRLG